MIVHVLTYLYHVIVHVLTYLYHVIAGGRRTEGLKAADIVPLLRERVAYLSGRALISVSTDCLKWRLMLDKNARNYILYVMP